MPGMSGPDLQRELIRRQRRIPIVFITASVDDSPPAPPRPGRGGVFAQAVLRNSPSRGGQRGAATELGVGT
jgi:CheY-like chemotaxis protein